MHPECPVDTESWFKFLILRYRNFLNSNFLQLPCVQSELIKKPTGRRAYAPIFASVFSNTTDDPADALAIRKPFRPQYQWPGFTKTGLGALVFQLPYYIRTGRAARRLLRAVLYSSTAHLSSVLASWITTSSRFVNRLSTDGLVYESMHVGLFGISAVLIVRHYLIVYVSAPTSSRRWTRKERRNWAKSSRAKTQTSCKMIKDSTWTASLILARTNWTVIVWEDFWIINVVGSFSGFGTNRFYETSSWEMKKCYISYLKLFVTIYSTTYDCIISSGQDLVPLLSL